MPAAEEIEKDLRVETRTYPQIAIRELVANAPVHQDMTVTGSSPIVEVPDDRVEVSNPGVPVTGMLNKLIGALARSRNEALANLMRRMGMCEELGSGLVKVLTAVEEHQLPAPDFRLEDAQLKVSLFGPRPFGSLDPMDRLRICYQHACLTFHNRKRMTNETLRARFGMEDRNAATVSRVFREAQARNLIRLADPELPKAGYVPFWA